jgi:hypothetical protein
VRVSPPNRGQMKQLDGTVPGLLVNLTEHKFQERVGSRSVRVSPPKQKQQMERTVPGLVNLAEHKFQERDLGGSRSVRVRPPNRGQKKQLERTVPGLVNLNKFQERRAVPERNQQLPRSRPRNVQNQQTMKRRRTMLCSKTSTLSLQTSGWRHRLRLGSRAEISDVVEPVLAKPSNVL